MYNEQEQDIIEVINNGIARIEKSTNEMEDFHSPFEVKKFTSPMIKDLISKVKNKYGVDVNITSMYHFQNVSKCTVRLFYTL